MESICFVIAHRYYRNYESFLELYITNIQRFYNDHLIIVVDNNSKHIEDIRQKFKDYKQLIIISNTTVSKFEVGAYNAGIQYIIDHRLLQQYDYYVFSQDNFVLKNKLEFTSLERQNIKACPFVSLPGEKGILYRHQLVQDMLNKLNISVDNPDINVCWCNSFILHQSKVLEFLDMTKDIVITTRHESELSERYLSIILYYLNGCSQYSLDLDRTLDYNCWTVDLYNSQGNNYFVKKVQQKNETTVDE